LGINDGGAEVPDLPARQAAYLDFLGEPTDSARRRRTGLYRALTFGVGPQAVKVLMLDTRSFRAPHAIPSVGAAARGVPLVGKLTPLAAAFSRWAAGALGWTAKHRGDVLGAAQWAWLEAQLKRGSEQETTNSAPAFTVVVSSVQVLTTAPVFESWGHFPVAKARLLALLRRYKPRGLLLLSGDVHFAELATYPVKADPVRDASVAGEDEGVGSGVVGCGSVAEVTSSGFTHTCLSPASNFLTRLTCTPVLTHYTSHRPHPGDFYAAAPNFGTLTIDWAASGGPLLTAAVRPTDRRDLGGQPALVLSRRSCLLDLPPIEPPHGNAYPQADESGAALRACTAPSESQGESRD
jgi:alkaline phosphatase D